jgi:hypothetical protein
MLRTRLITLAIALSVIIVGTACALTSSGGDQPNNTPQITVEPTLHPTFTPTTIPPSPTLLPPTPIPPLAEITPTPVSQPAAEIGEATPTAVTQPQEAPTQTPVSQPVEEPSPTAEPPTPTPQVTQVEVTAATVNLRSGPGTNYSRVGQASRGQTFAVIARNGNGDWLQIQRPNGNSAWVVNDRRWTQPIGDIMSVAVAQNIPAPPPTAKPAPTQPPAPTNTPAPTFAFDLILQEQFPQPNVVTIYLYVFSDSEPALGGYSLSVNHNGEALPVNAISQGGQPSQTWPVQSGRTRLTNMKVEFSGSPDGNWTVQLVDGGGTPQGPAATFSLTASEQNRELYVRYKRK